LLLDLDEEGRIITLGKMAEIFWPRTPDSATIIVPANLTAQKTIGAYAESISIGPKLMQNYRPTNAN